MAVRRHDRDVAAAGVINVLQRLSAGGRPEQALDELAVVAVGLPGATGAIVHLVHHDLLMPRPGAGAVSPWHRTFGPGEGAPGAALAAERTVVHPAPESAHGLAVSVPITGAHGIIGTLTVAFSDDAGLSDETLSTAELTAAAAAIAAAAVVGGDEERANRGRVASLIRKIARVPTSGDVRTTLQSMVEDAVIVVGCDRLLVLEVSDGVGVLHAAAGIDLDTLRIGSVPGAHLGVTTDAGTSVAILIDANADPVPQIATLTGARWISIAPAIAAGHVVGAVVAGWTLATPDPSQLLLVESLAAAVGLALALARSDVTWDASELQRTTADFFSTLSHELRTPLAVIKGAAETLQAHAAVLDDATRDQLLSRIRYRVNQEVELVEALLSLSQLDRGQARLRREPFDLVELTRSVARDHMEVTERRIAIDGPDDAPIVADRVALRQTISNLVGNALKFSEGEVRVGVDRGRRAWRVEVDDDGEGIAPALRERVFERFVQGADAARRGGGVGVGLAVVRGFVELHGGRVGVANAPRGGARFWFEIPDG